MGPLRKWFHDSRPEIWRQLSAELGASYAKGSWTKSDRIEVAHGDWTLTLDVYTVHANHAHIPYTRLRAPFANAEKFRLRVYRASIFTPLAKWMGMQDIEIGASEFDADWVVKSNDERQAKAFLADAALRARIAAQKKLSLSVEDDEGWFGKKFPADVDELRLVIGGHEKDPARLKELFELFADSLDRLCAIGAAYEKRPGLRL
ncbi:MAG: DUF3137 domain-containing protein [Planctomycetota bacterium]|jgi:hypothetical protein|nr:MAG: DUF3137 domain-containing protein [Planctomycetota bacterium]